jgi:hypothetical protein
MAGAGVACLPVPSTASSRPSAGASVKFKGRTATGKQASGRKGAKKGDADWKTENMERPQTPRPPDATATRLSKQQATPDALEHR